MDIYTAFFALMIFVFTLSLTLTAFAIRQRKNNRILSELVAQDKVEYVHNYSSIGVGVRNNSYVSKCPDCAEWINLEANVCKFCQNDVTSHNVNLERAMRKIDAEIVEVNIARKANNKAKRDALISNRVFRISVGMSMVVILTLIGLKAQSTYRYNKVTALPSSSSALIKSWNSILADCQFSSRVSPVPRAYENEFGTVLVQMRLPYNPGNFPDWKTSSGQEIACFSKKALAFDVYKNFGKNLNDNRVSLRNSFEVSIEHVLNYSFETSKSTAYASVEFSWRD